MLLKYLEDIQANFIPTIQSWVYIFLGIFFFLALEKIYPAEKNQNIKGVFHNLGITLIQFIANFLTSFFTGLFAMKILGYFNAPFIHIDLVDIVGRQSGLAQVVIGTLLIFVPLFVFDFFYYWFHRSQHQFSFLWLQHKFHHSDTDLNVTTVQRHHWLEEIYRRLLLFIPMSLLIKLNPYAIAWVSVILSYWSHFFHANIRLHLGWVGYIFLGPQAHRIHHSILPKHRDRNFAAFFPIWDILFGTYWHPAQNEYPATGVEGELSRPKWRYFMFEPITGVFRLLKK